ncbi:methionyl-tRNA formyltransferase [Spirochaetia bacterium]|nr:methionyl-tRNA formyltransferase [Spirochaetia bacterium]
MRIIFAGSPAIAVPCLEMVSKLAESAGAAVTVPTQGFELAGVLTNPDSSKGRHGRLEPTDVGIAAGVLSEKLAPRGLPPIPILKPEKLGGEAREAVAALKPDLLVSFAYGRIFGPKFLALFPLGGINIHPSLLPKYRGPTPIPRAILNRDVETGITVQRLATEMDSGDILLQERLPLGGRETTASLSEEAGRRAAPLLAEALRGIAAGTLTGRPQDHGTASCCALLSKDDGRIDWNKSAPEIDAQIRAYTPWPLSWTTHGDQYLYILAAETAPDTMPAGKMATDTLLSAAAGVPKPAPGTVLGVDKQRGILVQTGDGVLAVTMLQYRTKKALEWRAFLNGVRDFTGALLGTGILH